AEASLTGNVDVASNVSVNAEEHPDGDASSRGSSGGFIGVGASQSHVTIVPTVSAHLNGTTVNAGGSVTVSATATPPSSADLPDYSIQSVDPATDVIQVHKHGLTTGDVVEYHKPDGD